MGGRLSEPRAVVIGASVAGLLAARVAADHFAEVVLLDRDDRPVGVQPRKAVPQGRHPHGLLSLGIDVLDRMFPGLVDELAAHGGCRGDAQHDVAWHLGGQLLKRAPSARTVIGVSRPLLESRLRLRLEAHPRVRFLYQAEARSLAASDDRIRIEGVVWQPVADGGVHRLDAALVIDASGRASKMPEWLEALGYRAPPEERIRVDLSYVTFEFGRGPDGPRAPGDTYHALSGAHPGNPRPAGMVAIEDDRWIVMIGGYMGDRAPTDIEGFRACARTLDAPEIAVAIGAREPLGPARTYRFGASRRLRYERLRRFPQQLAVMGDAVCSFNPVYGHGISVAAGQARALDTVLHAGTNDVGRRLFAALRPLIDVPWQMAASADRQLPAVEGRAGMADRLLARYLDRLWRAARDDAELAAAFLEVVNLVQPLASLMRPAVVRRVLRGPARPPSAGA